MNATMPRITAANAISHATYRPSGTAGRRRECLHLLGHAPRHDGVQPIELVAAADQQHDARVGQIAEQIGPALALLGQPRGRDLADREDRLDAAGMRRQVEMRAGHDGIEDIDDLPGAPPEPDQSRQSLTLPADP